MNNNTDYVSIYSVKCLLMKGQISYELTYQKCLSKLGSEVLRLEKGMTGALGDLRF